MNRFGANTSSSACLAIRFVALAGVLSCAPAKQLDPETATRRRETPMVHVCNDPEAFRANVVLSEDAGLARRLWGWKPGTWPSETLVSDVANMAKMHIEACSSLELETTASRLVGHATPVDEPAAKGFDATEKFLRAWAKKHGLRFERLGRGDMSQLIAGTGPRRLTVLANVDTPPLFGLASKVASGAAGPQLAATGWETDPYAAVLHRGRLIGRGAASSKGPLTSALIMLRTLSLLQLNPEGEVAVVIGRDHNVGMHQMGQLATVQPPTGLVLSLDGDHPLTDACANRARWTLRLPWLRGAPAEGRPAAVNVSSPRRPGFVPDRANLVLEPARDQSVDELISQIRVHAEALTHDQSGPVAPPHIRVTEDRGRARIDVWGRQVPVGTNGLGRNALLDLALVAQRLELASNSVATFMRMLAKSVDTPVPSGLLETHYRDAASGLALVSAPVALEQTDQHIELTVELLQPPGLTVQQLERKLAVVLTGLRTDYDLQLTASEVSQERTATSAVGKPWIATLRGLYDDAQAADRAQSVRVPTYACLFERAAALGPVTNGPRHPAWVPNESVELADLGELAILLVRASLTVDAALPKPNDAP